MGIQSGIIMGVTAQEFADLVMEQLEVPFKKADAYALLTALAAAGVVMRDGVRQSKPGVKGANLYTLVPHAPPGSPPGGAVARMKALSDLILGIT